MTAEHARQMSQASDKLFCQLRDNNMIRFGQYQIKDYETGTVLMYISEEQQAEADKMARKEEEDGLVSLDTRTIRYSFGPDFLNLRTLSLKLEFYVVNDEPIKDLIFIERYYFKDRLISNFEFQFPFCMPKSKNDVEFVYDLPKFSEQEKQDIINNPWEMKSDSFYFANGQLIIHNKATYNYST